MSTTQKYLLRFEDAWFRCDRPTAVHHMGHPHGQNIIQFY